MLKLAVTATALQKQLCGDGTEEETAGNAGRQASNKRFKRGRDVERDSEDIPASAVVAEVVNTVDGAHPAHRPFLGRSLCGSH